MGSLDDRANGRQDNGAKPIGMMKIPLLMMSGALAQIILMIASERIMTLVIMD